MTTAGGPIVVLSYPHAGTEALTRMLSASPALACTSGTGLLSLCHSAAATWQQIENRDTGPSALAIMSIRTLASTMTTVIQAGTGARRWCETAFAPPAAAETFLRVFPDATFLSLHRTLQGVLAEGSRAYPWGLGGSPFGPYSGLHPGNNAATVAAYWAGCTEGLLEFETAHPRASLRIRHEDLTTSPQRMAADLFARLGLPGSDRAGRAGPAAAGSRAGGSDGGPGPPVPTAHLPLHLLTRIRELHARLDYDPV